MSFTTFFLANKWTLLFYTALILTIYLFRKRFDWQAKFIGLYRTKVGLKLMERLGKHRRFFTAFGYTGVVVGFLGMLLISGFLVKGIYDLFFVPKAPPTIYPALPGISVPGIGKIPLVTGWVALFIVIVIHEFSHGVVARAHKIPVKSSGLVVFGPIGGAFVEPDEKRLAKRPAWVRQSVFAAGPFSNIVTGFLFFALILFVLTPLSNTMTLQTGVRVASLFNGTGAANASLPVGIVITGIGNESVTNLATLTKVLGEYHPGERVSLRTATNDTYGLILGRHPSHPEKAFIGAQFSTVTRPKKSVWWYRSLKGVLDWSVWLFLWVYFFSLGIGLANLLPITITDGGRMFQIVTRGLFGKQRGDKLWLRVGSSMFIIILFLLVVSIVKQVV